MRKKALTVDCLYCDDMIVNDMQQFQCEWGKGKKILLPQKERNHWNVNYIRREKILENR